MHTIGKNPRAGFRKTFKTAAELQRLATTGDINWSQEDWSQQEKLAKQAINQRQSLGLAARPTTASLQQRETLRATLRTAAHQQRASVLSHRPLPAASAAAPARANMLSSPAADGGAVPRTLGGGADRASPRRAMTAEVLRPPLLPPLPPLPPTASRPQPRPSIAEASSSASLRPCIYGGSARGGTSHAEEAQARPRRRVVIRDVNAELRMLFDAEREASQEAATSAAGWQEVQAEEAEEAEEA